MNLNLVFLIIVSAVASGLLSYYHYFFKKKIDRVFLLPAFFRFLGIFCLLLLLINPRYHTKKSIIVKPELRVAWDASRSVEFSGADKQIAEVMSQIKANEKLNDQFEVQYYGFGQSLRLGDSLSFTSGQTDIDNSLSQLNQLSSSKISPVILISDGIQTVGRNYAYARIDQKVFPIVVGDTVTKNDLEITQVNVNAYVTLGNTFEVESFLSFTGKGQVNTELVLLKDDEVLERKTLTFSDSDRAKRAGFDLTASEPGQHIYRLRLTPFPGEAERLNNQKTFEVEVVNSQAEIAVIYAFPHPDLGMIKQSLEKEQKKSVRLIPISDWSPEEEGFSVYVLVQPDRRFREVFAYLSEQDKNYLLMAGNSADWSVINDAQKAFEKRGLSIPENAYPAFNEAFQSFYIDDLGYEEFPSLDVDLGQVEFRVPHEPILNQVINRIESGEPLLTVYEESGARRIALFGENIWKWRLFVFQRDQNFDRFDQFFDSLIQFLYLSDKKPDIELFYETTNFDDQFVRIQARKYDSNLNLDLSAPMQLKLQGQAETYPMYVNKGFYEVQLDELSPGNYSFRVSDNTSDAFRSGQFEVVSYSAEQIQLTSDVKQLTYLADKSGGEVFFPGDVERLFDQLSADPVFKPVEKIEKKRVSLIDQKWLLALIVLSLSVEWIIRKYRGLV